MQEILKLGIGIIVLLAGIPIGNYLAKFTKEELKPGKRWLRRLVITSLLATFIGFVIGDDVLLFSCAFIAIVTSRSLL